MADIGKYDDHKIRVKDRFNAKDMKSSHAVEYRSFVFQYLRYASFGKEMRTRKRILEIGCGTLHQPLYLRDADSYVGVDIAFQLLKKARKNKGSQRWKNKISILQADTSSLPFLPNSFDMVLLIEVIQYLEDLRTVAREAARVISPHGKCILMMPNPYFFLRSKKKGEYDTTNVWHLTDPDKVIRIFRTHFHVEKIRSWPRVPNNRLALSTTMILVKK
jgi:ubiquinone/menaquinone biosynthesis C-methylase UbiE